MLTPCNPGSETLSSRLDTLPNWAYCKANVEKAGLVNDSQKNFNALRVPVPDDKFIVWVDAGEKDVKKLG